MGMFLRGPFSTSSSRIRALSSLSFLDLFSRWAMYWTNFSLSLRRVAFSFSIASRGGYKLDGHARRGRGTASMLS
jgi:hypothetical protein